MLTRSDKGWRPIDVNAPRLRFARRHADVGAPVAIAPLDWVWRRRGDVIEASRESEMARRREREILSGTFQYVV
jgi:hypothetical protein